MLSKPCPRDAGPRTHDWIDERSLALHEADARELCADPERVLGIARANIARWMKTMDARTLPTLQEWVDILNTHDVQALIEFITSWNERSRRLRQSSPFVGVISAEERMSIFERFEAMLKEPP